MARKGIVRVTAPGPRTPPALPLRIPCVPACLPAIVLVLASLATPSRGAAQADHDHDHTDSPYAGAMEGREIKALAPDEVEGLLRGEGLGFALTAELNGVPGPLHVLELADALALTPEQRGAVEEVRRRMQGEAQELGARLVEEERHLDRMFARGHASATSVRDRAAVVAGVRGRLRAVHLVAHLETAAILEPDQIEAYRRLRGYADPGG